jgi:hypothetical protein
LTARMPDTPTLRCSISRNSFFTGREGRVESPEAGEVLNGKKNGSSARGGNHSRPLEINCGIRFCYIFAFLEF